MNRKRHACFDWAHGSRTPNWGRLMSGQRRHGQVVSHAKQYPRLPQRPESARARPQPQLCRNITRQLVISLYVDLLQTTTPRGWIISAQIQRLSKDHGKRLWWLQSTQDSIRSIPFCIDCAPAASPQDQRLCRTHSLLSNQVPYSLKQALFSPRVSAAVKDQGGPGFGHRRGERRDFAPLCSGRAPWSSSQASPAGAHKI